MVVTNHRNNQTMKCIMQIVKVDFICENVWTNYFWCILHAQVGISFFVYKLKYSIMKQIEKENFFSKFASVRFFF